MTLHNNQFWTKIHSKDKRIFSLRFCLDFSHCISCICFPQNDENSVGYSKPSRSSHLLKWFYFLMMSINTDGASHSKWFSWQRAGPRAENSESCQIGKFMTGSAQIRWPLSILHFFLILLKRVESIYNLKISSQSPQMIPRKLLLNTIFIS